MIYLEKYNKNKVYMSPGGVVMDQEQVRKEFPAALQFAYVMQTDETGEMMYSMDSLSMMRTRYGIDASLDEDAAIAAVKQAMEEEQDAQAAAAEEAANTATAEERIAAALEYQVMSSLPDEDAE
jgi:spore germination cell wall hydrolase CwlJ-like protein